MPLTSRTSRAPSRICIRAKRRPSPRRTSSSARSAASTPSTRAPCAAPPKNKGTAEARQVAMYLIRKPDEPVAARYRQGIRQEPYHRPLCPEKGRAGAAEFLQRRCGIISRYHVEYQLPAVNARMRQVPRPVIAQTAPLWESWRQPPERENQPSPLIAIAIQKCLQGLSVTFGDSSPSGRQGRFALGMTRKRRRLPFWRWPQLYRQHLSCPFLPKFLRHARSPVL